MANVFNVYKKLLADSSPVVDITTANRYYAMLMTATSAFPIAVTHLDYATLSALEANMSWTETTVGGYAVDFLAAGTSTQNDTDDRAELALPKAVYTSLATGQTIVAALLVRATTANVEAAATDLPTAAYDVGDTATNGGDMEVRWSNVDGTGDAIHIT